MNEEQVKQIVARVVAHVMEGDRDTVPVEVSARHVHLTQTDVEALFGPGSTLTPKRPLSQPGQFLAEERVSIVTAKGEFRNVAVLGPVRDHTQVEISRTDARALGLDVPVRLSGDAAGCPAVCLLAGGTVINAPQSVLVARNHIHMTPADAAFYGVEQGQQVQVRMETDRPVIFDDVVIRVSQTSKLAMHIDSDEANACAFGPGAAGRILRR